MKALVLESKDKAPAIREVQDPLLKANLIQVRVKAAALNHRDVWITKGLYAGINYPVILGSDVAGVVEEVGKGVDEGMLGQSVILNPSHDWGPDDRCQGKEYKILGLPDNGGFAELLTVDASYAHAMPEHLSYAQAAALPLAGLTAWRALMTRAHMQPGDKVLVTGIGGGVALFVLQFALAHGCEVWVTSGNPKKIEAAKGLGAAGGANYKTDGWAKELRSNAGQFDVIIDSAGGPGFAGLLDLAAPGGRIAVYGGTAGNYEGLSPQKIFWKQLSILGSTMGTPADFHNMMRFVREHKIVPIIDEVFPFKEANKAFTKMDKGKQFGKLVLEISGS